MARPFLSIIIPAYNEAERLPLTLIDIDRHLSKQSYSYEILVVADDSEDATLDIVRKFLPVIRHLKFIATPERRGKGAAIRIGMLAGKGNWRLAMDADNTVSIVGFSEMLPFCAAGSGYDIIIASRGFKETRFEPPLPFLRSFAEWFLSFLYSRVFSVPVKDFFLGFQCFSGESADKIFPLTKSHAWSHGAEALVLGNRMGFKVREIPVHAAYAAGSHFKSRYYYRMYWDLASIWLRFKNGKYAMTFQKNHN